MGLYDLLRRLTETLEQLKVPYAVTGSMASSAYGDPRLTNDIDVVADLQSRHVAGFCAAFPEPDFYCPPSFVSDAVNRRFQFNVLHPESGYKIDVMVAGQSEFDQLRLRRAVRVHSGPNLVPLFASPEDVILKKLEYFKEGGSEKHIRDILGVLKTQGERIDRTYIAEWAARLAVTSEWKLILSRLTGSE
jgi:hypothetical protein